MKKIIKRAGKFIRDFFVALLWGITGVGAYILPILFGAYLDAALGTDYLVFILTAFSTLSLFFFLIYTTYKNSLKEKRKPKEIIIMLLKEIRDIASAILKGTFKLAGVLFGIAILIIIFLLFGYIAAGLSATTIIIILLVLLLLK